jgi:hypothetical protein
LRFSVLKHDFSLKTLNPKVIPVNCRKSDSLVCFVGVTLFLKELAYIQTIRGNFIYVKRIGPGLLKPR